MDVMEKLVDIVCDAIEDDACICHCNHPPCFAVERVVNALISNGITVQWWKPISEPPKEKGTYLVCTENGGVLLGHWYGANWNAGGGANKHLAYWMEKPQPPKGE